MDGKRPSKRPAASVSQSLKQPVVELVTIVALALIIAAGLQTFVAKPYRIPSESMQPTLAVGQRIIVNRLEGRFGHPERFDVLVFKPPAGAESQTCGVRPGETYLGGMRYEADAGQKKMPCPRGTTGQSDEAFVKRVVGMPGDMVSVERGRVLINGKALREPYVSADADCLTNANPNSDCNFPTPIRIAPGHYFMMGDNRNAGSSFDSRFWGPIPERAIVGSAVFTYWPPGRIGGL